MKKWHYFIVIPAVFFMINCSDNKQKKVDNNDLNISKIDLVNQNLETLSLKNYD